MAVAGNNYRLLIEGQLSTDKIQAKLEAFQKKAVLNFRLDDKSFNELEKRLDKIRSSGGTITKVKTLENDFGKIGKAVIEYTNSLGQAEKRTEIINKGLKTTKERYVDINKSIQDEIKLQQSSLVLTKKQEDEMERVAHQAELFLAKSENLAKTKPVQAAVSKAQEIKTAVDNKEIDKVRTLNKEFSILKASLQTGRTGLDSWSEGMKNALRQTIEYAASVGLVYGALNQLKEGVQYLTELDKEMTSIQIVTGETDDEIANLSLGYNNLAKDLGATTLEVAKGSLEWRRQGKTVEETSQLMESTMMMSKLANMESAQATEYLTSILNGFKLEAEDAEDVISKLV